MCSRRSVSRRVNRDLSPEELEGRRWSVPAGGETRLMATVRELRRKPVGGLTVEDMRLLIGQDVGLAYLLPLAMEVLRVNPLAEGDMYEGDLLAAVLTRSAEVWRDFPELRRAVREIVSELADVPPTLKVRSRNSWLCSSPAADAVGAEPADHEADIPRPWRLRSGAGSWGRLCWWRAGGRSGRTCRVSAGPRWSGC
ncbi:contact-dependent growth inhibition system immunity protein [Streptomyces nigra]